MYESSDKLFDDVLKHTQNSRYEYLETLIEKYVINNQDEIVNIDLSTFTLYESKTKYLKKMSKKEFGCVTSYECKPAKRTMRYLKKRIVLEKRDSFRKHIGVESSEEYHSINSKRNLKYLTPHKVYKTLLSIQENESSLNEASECEESECSETKSSDDYSVSSVEESESTLSSEDNPSFSSDTVKIVSEMKQNSVSKSVSKDKKLSANNVQQFSNFEVKNCDGNLLKFYDSEQVKTLTEKLKKVLRNSSEDKVLKIVYEKLAVFFKGSSSGNSEKRGNNSAFAVSNFESSFDYALFKFPPKLKLSDIGMGIAPKIYQVKNKSVHCTSIKSTVPSKFSYSNITSDKNCQGFSVNKDKLLPFSLNKSSVPFVSSCSKIKPQTPDKNCQGLGVNKDKSLPFSSNKSSVLSTFSFSKIRAEASNKNGQILQNSPPLKNASLLSSESPISRNVNIDALSLTKVSDDRKPSKQKSLLSQNTLSFRTSKSHNVFKEYKDSHRENFVTIDDLSIKKNSRNRKKH